MALTLYRTKGKGLPALWEEGGGWTNTGEAQIVCGPHGEKKRALYGGHGYCCGRHVLFLVHPGDVVVRARHWRRFFTIAVYRLGSIEPTADQQGYKAETELIARYQEGEWAPELPPEFADAVEAAKWKATSYHCRHGIYFEPPFPERKEG